MCSTGHHHSEQKTCTPASPPSGVMCLVTCLRRLVRPELTVPARGLAYCASHYTSTPLRFGKYILHILLWVCQVNVWKHAFTLADSSTFRLLLYSLPTALLLALMWLLHGVFDLVKIVILFAVVSTSLPIVAWYHGATCPTSSAVYSASRCGHWLSSSIQTFFSASVWSTVIAPQLHYTTLPWATSSCLTDSTTHARTALSDPGVS